MTVFSLTTMRYFMPYDFAGLPGIRGYLGRIGSRDAYRRAMAKGDPGMELLLT
jgi:glutathione S-transferase